MAAKDLPANEISFSFSDTVAGYVVAFDEDADSIESRNAIPLAASWCLHRRRHGWSH